jgi:2-polyprenyl-6-methoxyphenol hydroxylase-like FAD-dependent oxidoreductase
MYDNLHLAQDHLLYGRTVAIVGGGPAGLTLACLLQRKGIQVRIFERELTRASGKSGGSLDLHEGSGQYALERCGLLEQFRMASRPDAQAVKVLDRHATLNATLDESSVGESKPEIDRGELQALLYGALEPGSVSVGKTLMSVAPSDGDRYSLCFDTGERVIADVVVGCDGAWSKVRPLLTDTAPHYTGVTFVETSLLDADRNHPAASQLVGAGSMLSLGDQKGILAQRNGDGSIRLYIARRIDEHWARGGATDFRNPEAVRAQLLSWFDDWSPLLVDMLRHSEDRFYAWPLFALRPERPWGNTPGVTLIGDAAHVMPPFSGLGANMAMLDAVELADHLLDAKFRSVKSAIAAFEQSMFDRMTPIVEEALATQDVMFTDDAPAQLLAVLETKHEGS